MCVVRRPDPRNTHVSDADVAISLEQQVLRLDVSVDHTIVVHIFETDQYVCNEKLGLRFSEPLAFIMVVTQISPRD